MFSLFLELIGVASVAGGCYAKWGPDGYWKRLAKCLGCDWSSAISLKRD